MQRNQENKADNGKSNPLLLYQDLDMPLRVVNRVLDYGVEKYERKGWEKVDPERYQEALLRHMRDYLSGEQFDNESGLLHLAHLATNALFLLHFNMVDEVPRCVYLEYNKPPQAHKEQ